MLPQPREPVVIGIFRVVNMLTGSYRQLSLHTPKQRISFFLSYIRIKKSEN